MHPLELLSTTIGTWHLAAALMPGTALGNIGNTDCTLHCHHLKLALGISHCHCNHSNETATQLF